jgi:predicted transcriptional regulator
MKNQKAQISDREMDVMQALWKLGEGSVGDVHRQLDETKIELAYTTVQTLLNRLEVKGIVERDASSRAHRYRPLVKEPSTIGGAIDHLVKRFFDGSVEALVTRLVENDLTDEQIRRVQAMIDTHDKKGAK